MHFHKAAFRLVILFGCISLLADISYEGARSITGPYLALLGATGFIVAFVSGLGEFIGYALRAYFGYITDRLRLYWFITILGYTITLISIPLLAFANSWEMAFLLLFFERLGKAIRTPARDAMLSYATKEMGRGFGFGIHKFLDQTGAVLGPIIMAFTLSQTGSYREGFLWMAIPGALTLLMIFITKSLYPAPEKLEVTNHSFTNEKLPKKFWLYVIAVGFVAAGMIDFPLIAYHFHNDQILSPVWIPLAYALAMGMEGLSGLFLGPLFDRYGLIVLLIAVLCVAFFPLLVFSNIFSLALLGTVLWGIGMGVQETVMRAYVATIVTPEKRATAYGYLNGIYGTAWLIGSLIIGLTYDYSVTGVIIISCLLQLMSIPILWKLVPIGTQAPRG